MTKEEQKAYNKVYNASHKKEMKAHNDRYRASHKEETKVYNAIYYAAHKDVAAAYRDEHKEKIADYRASHKEEVKAYNAVYRDEHKEELSAKSVIYREKNRERISARAGKWQKDNPDKACAITAKRKALILEATIGDIDEIKEVYRRAKEDEGIVCYLCGEVVEKGLGHVDHVFPLSKGGAHTASNLRITHAHCNFVKHDTILEPILLNPGDRVIDREGDIGTVVNSDDPHNVQVHYDNGGSSINCIVPECESFEGLWPEGASEKENIPIT